jgi:DNA-binding response OmpR family regulator
LARILIIDDDETYRSLLKNRFEREGFETELAPEGNTGIKLFKQGNFDLVITDLIMPDKEGVETITELRRDYPQVKIIAMSGGGISAAESLLNTAQKLGANRVIVKPFEWDDMLHLARELLQ